MLGFLNVSSGEVIVALLVAVLVFGRRLPDVAKAVGRAIAELRKELNGVSDVVEDEDRNNSGDR